MELEASHYVFCLLCTEEDSIIIVITITHTHIMKNYMASPEYRQLQLVKCHVIAWILYKSNLTQVRASIIL